MTNNSGKFVSTVSNIETEMSVEEIKQAIPATPKVSIIQYIEEYFGKYWWLWIVLILIIKKKKQ